MFPPFSQWLKDIQTGEGFKKRRPPPMNLHLLGVPKHFHRAEVAAHGARFLMFVGFAALVEDSGVDGGFAHGGPVKGHAGLRHLGFAGERMGAAKATSPACAATREAMMPCRTSSISGRVRCSAGVR